MERYLGSGAIKGVGPALAKRITKKFKMDTFRVIEEEPERLAEVKGISEKKARAIAVESVSYTHLCNEAGIDAYFPIVRSAVSLEDAMKKKNAQENLIDTVEQVFPCDKSIKIKIS